jgi:hypothetical protein
MASMIDGGSIVIAIKGNMDDLTKAAEEAEKTVSAKFEDIAFKTGAAFAAVGAAVVGGLGMMTSKFATVGDDFAKMSGRTGETVKNLYELGHAAELSGATIGTVETALQRMQRGLVDAADGTGKTSEAFAKLGLNLEHIKGLSPADQMVEIGTAIAQIPDPAERAALAVEIFGRQGAQLLPMFMQGKAGIAAMRAEVEGAAQSLEESAPMAEAWNDAWLRLNKTFEEFAIEIGPIVVEAIIPMIDSTREFLKEIAQWMRENPALTATIIEWGGALGVTSLALGTLLMAIKPFMAIFGLLKGGFALVGGAATLAAGTAGTGAAAAGGVGIAGMTGALIAAAPVILASAAVLGVLAVATYKVGAAYMDWRKAEEEKAKSAEALTQKEYDLATAMRMRGVEVDLAVLKEKNADEVRLYLANQEKDRADQLARAWFEYYTGRTESEEDFAMMRNLMLNKEISAQQAAALVSQNISAETAKMIMTAKEGETKHYLSMLGMQVNAVEDAEGHIGSAVMESSKERQEQWRVEADKVINENRRAADESASVWSRFAAWLSGLFSGFAGGPAMGPGGIPGYATGGVFGQTGSGHAMAIVGERGPEVAFAPVGTRVISHGEAVAALSGGGETNNFNIAIHDPIVREERDIQRLATAVAEEVSRQQGREYNRRQQGRGLMPQHAV